MTHLRESSFLFKHFRAQFMTISEHTSHSTGPVRLYGGQLLSTQFGIEVSHDISCNLQCTRGKPAVTVVTRIWSVCSDCISLTLAGTYVRRTKKMHTFS